MVGNGLSPEQRKAIEAELAEHTAYRALLAAAEQASAEVVRNFTTLAAWNNETTPGYWPERARLAAERKAWGDVIVAARERARKAQL
jgi:hypothetical protein